MTETDALLKIASALEHIASALEMLGLVAWLTLIFKSQSSNSSIEKLTNMLRERLSARQYIEIVHDESKTTNHR